MLTASLQTLNVSDDLKQTQTHMWHHLHKFLGITDNMAINNEGYLLVPKLKSSQ